MRFGKKSSIPSGPLLVTPKTLMNKVNPQIIGYAISPARSGRLCLITKYSITTMRITLTNPDDKGETTQEIAILAVKKIFRVSPEAIFVFFFKRTGKNQKTKMSRF